METVTCIRSDAPARSRAVRMRVVVLWMGAAKHWLFPGRREVETDGVTVTLAASGRVE